jgi:hypothetical protein
MIGLWHAAVGDWLHGSSCMDVSCSLQSISRHYHIGAISLFPKEKVFVLINPPTNYIISRTIMSCSQFLNYVHNFYGGFDNTKLSNNSWTKRQISNKSQASIARSGMSLIHLLRTCDEQDAFSVSLSTANKIPNSLSTTVQICACMDYKIVDKIVVNNEVNSALQRRGEDSKERRDSHDEVALFLHVMTKCIQYLLLLVSSSPFLIHSFYNQDPTFVFCIVHLALELCLMNSFPNLYIRLNSLKTVLIMCQLCTFHSMS